MEPHGTITGGDDKMEMEKELVSRMNSTSTSS